MSRFVNNRRLVLLYCAVSIAAGNMVLGSPQPSYADSWAELLKPLVKNVIVPGASMGMKKLIERNNKKDEQSTEGNPESSTTDNSWQDSAFSSAENSTTDSSSWQDSAFSTPEEPMSSSSTDDLMMMATPEEPISVSSQETSPMEPPPPPPPPVATP